ncbi:DoxX family protein, partial [Bacteroides fragilis]
VYLIIFVLMYISGPGKYSVDYVIGRQLKNKRKL